ncbi:MAG TPA: hypothetical protein VMH49_03245 [Thermoplasmata archaeon]|nr:hypothetical protein [Thermoplasmata archaeon]
MLAPPVAVPEHLTPHDLVAYFRCPHEMELEHVRRHSGGAGPPAAARTPENVVPLRHSPLLPPPLGAARVSQGRLAFAPSDQLVYVDDGEDELPVLFPPEQVRLDPRFRSGYENLVDPSLGFAGRPDLVVALAGRQPVPLEYKATHLFVGYHEAHGRLFDTVQAIAQCRLVEATFGQRPPYGIVLYGDAAGDGLHEGWVEVPYGDAEAGWLRYALRQVRSDTVRAPVPAERNCGGCEPNGEGLCRFAAARYEGPHHRVWAASLRR